MKDPSPQRKLMLLLLLLFKQRNLNYISIDLVFFSELGILKISRLREIQFESYIYNYFSFNNKEIQI